MLLVKSLGNIGQKVHINSDEVLFVQYASAKFYDIINILEVFGITLVDIQGRGGGT